MSRKPNLQEPPIEAYDDRQGAFVASDPYLGAPYRITYADFAQIWARSDQGFVVLYPPSRQAMVSAVLAAVGWDRRRAFRCYGYLRLAWDELQLGYAARARRALAQAAEQGANPVEVGWISQEIARQTRA